MPKRGVAPFGFPHHFRFSDTKPTLPVTYYEENPKADAEDRTEEADKVAVRIAKLLSEKAFSFTPNEYISIHKKLFAGIYGHAGNLRDYNITKKEWVLNGAIFVSRLWQIHVFGEGNPRTTAVFIIKYLRTLGFDVTNDIFAENAWYFRNALARANYNDLKNGVHETTEYLEMITIMHRILMRLL